MSDLDNLQSVPDDAPPVVLFRLSYRADVNHRSGYRPGDGRERIVASMRGWWELDPDEVKSLNIKYAVAFHRGVTRAVVEIDGWKWHDVPGSDHNVFDADADGYLYRDDRWRGRDDVRWCFTPRATDSSRAANVPNYVEEAWIGAAGKRVPVSMRDTIVAFWPTSPIDSPRDLVGKALELLGRGMMPRMQAVYELRCGDDWHYELRQKHGIFASEERVPLHDPYVYLQVLLRREEAATFEKVFTVTTQPTLEQLRDARNRWAHFDTIDASQASQDVREMQMLLTDLGAADEARRMAQIQRTLDLMVRSGRS